MGAENEWHLNALGVSIHLLAFEACFSGANYQFCGCCSLDGSLSFGHIILMMQNEMTAAYLDAWLTIAAIIAFKR